jgi:thiamine biosynthesis protein ThiS
MKITINGKEKNIKENLAINDLAKLLKLKPNAVVFEHNGEILNKDQWSKKLKANDKIEIISLVGGG